MKSEVADSLRAIFQAPNREEADRLLSKALLHYEKKAPRLCTWMEMNIAEGLTVFAFPLAHRKRLRTSNLAERVNREVKRRTRVATLFPFTASCERLVSAVLAEISEVWESGRIYLAMNKQADESLFLRERQGCRSLEQLTKAHERLRSMGKM
jgi:putative transposase